MNPSAVAQEDLVAKTYHSRVRAWTWYDWADHAYITTTASTFFPPYFIAIAAPAFVAIGVDAASTGAQALARDTASNIFSFTVSFALLIAAILADRGRPEHRIEHAACEIDLVGVVAGP